MITTSFLPSSLAPQPPLVCGQTMALSTILVSLSAVSFFDFLLSGDGRIACRVTINLSFFSLSNRGLRPYLSGYRHNTCLPLQVCSAPVGVLTTMGRTYFRKSPYRGQIVFHCLWTLFYCRTIQWVWDRFGLLFFWGGSDPRHRTHLFDRPETTTSTRPQSPEIWWYDYGVEHLWKSECLPSRRNNSLNDG